jgi:hypothetical protein
MFSDASVSHILRDFIFFGFEENFLLSDVIKNSADRVDCVGKDSTRDNSHQNAVHLLQS